MRAHRRSDRTIIDHEPDCSRAASLRAVGDGRSAERTAPPAKNSKMMGSGVFGPVGPVRSPLRQSACRSGCPPVAPICSRWPGVFITLPMMSKFVPLLTRGLPRAHLRQGIRSVGRRHSQQNCFCAKRISVKADGRARVRVRELHSDQLSCGVGRQPERHRVSVRSACYTVGRAAS